MRGLRPMVCALVVALVAPLAASPAAAQRPRDVLQERIKALRHDVLLHHVGLTKAQTRIAENIIASFDPQRRKLMREMRQARRAIRQLLRQDSADQAAYKAAVNRMRTAQKKLQTLRDREFEALAKKMTPKQQAKLLIALQRIQKRIREMVREMRRRR